MPDWGRLARRPRVLITPPPLADTVDIPLTARQRRTIREHQKKAYMTEIWEMTANEIVAEVRARRLSALEVTEVHLNRLANVNPAINAVVQEFPGHRVASRPHISRKHSLL